jgi:hypothetical protein
MTYNPGAVFEMEDGPEVDRLLKLRAAKAFVVEEKKEDYLTDEEVQKIKEELKQVKGMTDEFADALIDAEVQSLEALAKCKAKQLYKVVGKEKASSFIRQAKGLLS